MDMADQTMEMDILDGLDLGDFALSPMDEDSLQDFSWPLDTTDELGITSGVTSEPGGINQTGAQFPDAHATQVQGVSTSTEYSTSNDGSVRNDWRTPAQPAPVPPPYGAMSHGLTSPTAMDVQQLTSSPLNSRVAGTEPTAQASRVAGTEPTAQAHDQPRAPTQVDPAEMSGESSFRVLVHFQSSRVLETTVSQPGGCLLFYKPPQSEDAKPANGVLSVPITLPIKKARLRQESVWTDSDFQWKNDKHERLTKKILNGFLNGIEICAKKDNAIYVTRRCRAYVYWLSTQCTRSQAYSLEQNEETKVFDAGISKTYLRNNVIDRERGEPTNFELPACWLILAQKWHRDTPRTQHLVWVRIDPLDARHRMESVQPDVKLTSHDDSLNSGNICLSGH